MEEAPAVLVDLVVRVEEEVEVLGGLRQEEALHVLVRVRVRARARVRVRVRVRARVRVRVRMRMRVVGGED